MTAGIELHWPTSWEVVGWTGNACYFGRFFLQWLRSEQAKRSVTPHSFWWLSLGGAILLSSYTWEQGQWILFAGYLITILIYARNLWLAYVGPRGRLVGPMTSAALVVVGAAFMAWSGLQEEGEDVGTMWVACAAIGTCVWSSRFFVQWRASEQLGRSHFPRSFWWLSLVGSVFLIAYTIRLGDAVLIAGYAPAFLVPLRNLMLAPDEAESVAERVSAGEAARRHPQ